MAGFSPTIPLIVDPDDGYSLNKTLKDVAKQNFKNLILTSPGERMMDPEFGVGMRSYLFANNNTQTQGQIDARIRQQAQKYLPYIQVDLIEFNDSTSGGNISENYLSVRISYIIKKLAIADSLEIPIN
tara:strand:- start:13 stop:396 length:384 start_codon:yes stop_codon:yes gene_type:complete